MKRRDYLIGSVAAITSLAGCGSPGQGVNETDGSPDGLGTEPGDGSPEETPTEIGSPAGTGSPTETGTGNGAPSVEMVTEGDQFFFDPVGLAVEPGTSVEWTNTSGTHSSTSYDDRIPDGAEPWDSGILSEEGATFSHTFDVEGTYDYYCTPHQATGMVARIVVGQPGGPAEGSMPPDGDVPESSRIVEEGRVSYDDFTGG